MIKIIYEPGRITVTGHAGFAPPGQDIVCSAISVLVQTLSRSVAQLTDDMAEGLEIPGKAIIITEHLSDERAKLLVDAFLIGVNGVAEAYADYVEIIDTRECRGGNSNPAGAKGG